MDLCCKIFLFIFCRKLFFVCGFFVVLWVGNYTYTVELDGYVWFCCIYIRVSGNHTEQTY